MQRAVIRALEDKCIQNSPPGCTTMCPVHVDVKRLNELVLKGDFNQAAELFQKNIPFPEIISRICDHPCQVYCKRCDAGGSVRISMLEEACVKYGSYPQKTIKPFKKTGKRVAIAGSGLSGLTAAFHLHQKGHEIHIFEKNSIIGGRVRSYSSDRLPAELIDKDFAIISSMEIQIHTNTEIGRDISFEELLRTHDAVYLGLGEPLRQTGEPETPGIFKGGTMLRNGDYSPILSISEGRGAAISIDRYLKRVSLTEGRENEGQYTSSLYTSLEGVVSAEPVEPEEPQMGFSRDEALREASRCLQCECMECVKACVFLKQYEGYPKLYIREIANAVNQIYGVRKHKMMINSCTNCGLCAEVCPNRLDMGEVCRDAKNEMVEKELMPPAIHDFPINDMLFSNSDEFAMFRHQPGYEDSKYAFYPGCQLSGLRPGHVERVYKELSTELEGGVGLFLGCCGAPAQWSGRTGLYEAALAGFRKTWLENGRPVIIYACTSCHRMLGESFPEIEFISIWELMAQNGFNINKKTSRAEVRLHDPCTSRHLPEVQESVRSIIKRMGLDTAELKFGKDRTKCCGYGGMVSYANRPMAREMAKAILEELNPGRQESCSVREEIDARDVINIAYCAICQEHLTREGGNVHHLLDLIYNESGVPGREPLLSLSQRHENRIKLKKVFLEKVWKENNMGNNRENNMENDMGNNSESGIELVIDGEMAKKLDQRLILASDLEKVICHAENTGSKVFNPKTQRFTASLKPGIITYWAEYTIEDGKYIICNAYSHRLEIKD